MNDNKKIPGEKIASIEEYLPGDNTFEDGDSIRATTIGEINLDSSERLASINQQKQITVPNVGDVIIGVVEANLPSMIAIMIKFVNGKKVNSQKLKLPSGKILKGESRKDFEVAKIKIDVLKSNLIAK